jgi:hypothetical protein
MKGPTRGTFKAFFWNLLLFDPKGMNMDMDMDMCMDMNMDMDMDMDM